MSTYTWDVLRTQVRVNNTSSIRKELERGLDEIRAGVFPSPGIFSAACKELTDYDLALVGDVMRTFMEVCKEFPEQVKEFMYDLQHFDEWIYVHNKLDEAQLHVERELTKEQQRMGYIPLEPRRPVNIWKGLK